MATITSSKTRGRQHWSLKSTQLLVVFISSFLIGIIFLSWLSYKISPEYWPIGVDVYPRWTGTRAFLNGYSPYSESVDLLTQDLIYGRPALPTEESFGYYYPAFTSVILAPLALLPVEIAAIIWSAFMGAILTSLIISMTLFAANRLSPLPWGALLLSFLLYRPALLSVLNGQYGLFVLGCWGLSLWLIKRDKYLSAGFLVAFSMIKPSISLIPATYIIVWSLLSGRTRIARGFFSMVIIMTLISFERIGWWVPEFLSELGEYSLTFRTWSFQDIFTFPGMLWLLSAGLLLTLGYKEFKRNWDFSYNFFFGGLLLNLLFTPHTLEYDLTVLLLPLLFIAATIGKSVTGYLYIVFLIWLPWLSWIMFNLAGFPIEYWWKSIWFSYPLLVSSTLVLIAIPKRKRRIYAHRLFYS